MREIKFRAWNKKTKWMHSWSDLCCLPHELRILKEPEPYILMQFTGLTDKNGKEIYEGDIIKDTYTQVGHTVYIYWNNGWCQWECMNVKKNPDLEHIDDARWDLHNCEVIGNIYENPELLEGK